MLWHGGYRSAAQLALAAIAAAGVAAVRPRSVPLRSPLWLGLAVAAAANVASLAVHRGGSSVAPALAAVAVPVIVATAAAEPGALRRRMPVIVLALGMATATAGLAGLALHTGPLAERIDGVWRAGGTFEYPPALGLICVCALAYALALHASGDLDRTTTVIAAAVVVAAAVATFDRVAWIGTVAIATLFAVRAPATRRAITLLAAIAICGAAASLVLSHPNRSALERHLRHGPLSARRAAWSHAWRAAGRRPLLGYGPGRYLASYQGASLSTAPVAQAHDAVLEQAVEAGLVAALGTAVALVAMGVAGATAAWRGDPLRAGHGVTALAIALSGLYDFTWSFAPILLLGALAAVAAGAHDP